MKYKIVVDSCCELPEELVNDPRVEIVPLELTVGETQMTDDESFDQRKFLNCVAESKECPRSASPSPMRYMEAFLCDAERVYCVTLSSKLSGSYSSAMVGRELVHEEDPSLRVHIIDSESASGGETQLVLKIMELEELNFSAEEIVNKVIEYRDSIQTFFVLDSLEALKRNGRLTGLKAAAATALNIKPVLAGNHGEIVQRGQGIGTKKALKQMVEVLVHGLNKEEKRTLIISHCNAPERAEAVKKMFLEQADFLRVVILNTRGVSSMYASNGGIIVAA